MKILFQVNFSVHKINKNELIFFHLCLFCGAITLCVYICGKCIEYCWVWMRLRDIL